MSYVHKYRPAWEVDAELKGWIAADPNDNTRAQCRLCRCFLKAHKKDLLSHGKSKKHQESEKRCQAGPSRKITDFITPSITIQRKTAELKIAAFIAEHCATKTADHLSDLMNNLDGNSELLSGVKIHRTKCTALILNVIAPSLLSDLIHDIGDQKYSLIVDESTAIDATKMMCVMIKYFSAKKQMIVTTFYRLVTVEGGDAATLSEALRKQMVMDNLPVKNIIGLGVDGANVMVGTNNSVSTIMRELSGNENMIIVKCVCHSLHLAAEHSFRVLPKHLDFLIRECYNWFSHSTKRQLSYKRLYQIMNENAPQKIDKLSGTRWLARSNAVLKILNQWDVLKLHFELAKDVERCYVAQQLCEMLSDRRNYLYLVFLNKTLKSIIKVNTAFQSDNANSFKLMEDLLHLLKDNLSIIIPPMRLERITDRNLITFDFENYMMGADFLNLGLAFDEAAKDMDRTEVLGIRNRCKDFLVQLCKQIQIRLPNNIDILEKMCALSPENATVQVQRPNITELVNTFQSMGEDRDATVSEWNALHRIDWKHTDDVDSFWIEVTGNKDCLGKPRFGNISKLAISLLCLPFSNATVERAFSMANIVKDKLRNRLNIATTDAIMRVRYHVMTTGCANFSPSDDMLRRFNSNMYQCTVEENVLELFNDME